MAAPLLPSLGADASDAPAVVFPERTLTHAGLAAAARGVAFQIAGRSRVAVLAEARPETCVAVVGALLAGIPVVLVNPKSGTSEMEHVVADADPGALLRGAGSDVPAAFADREAVVVDLDVAPAEHALLPEPPPEAPALIVYTSGTTGPPKGAVLPRRAIAANLDGLAEAWAWTGADRVVHGLPLFHVHGLVLGILGPLRLGGTAQHLGRFSAEGVEQALAADATMLFGVPTMYRRLAEAAQSSPGLAAALARARLLVSGSAPLPAAEHDRLREITGTRVVERYGMTETLMITAVRADGERRAGEVGPPVPGVEVRLVDDDGAELAASDGETIAEVEVRGPSVFLGYLNRPDATAQAFRDGWFRTGDLATRSADGAYRIVGRRATDLIKSGGYKIGAGEIEAALRDHPAVDDAAVTAEADADLGERVVAWVVLRAGARAGAAELTDHVAAHLAPHKRPRTVHFVAELPRNELGKVLKQRLVPVA